MHRRSKVAGSVGDLMHIYYSPSPIYLKKKKKKTYVFPVQSSLYFKMQNIAS